MQPAVSDTPPTSGYSHFLGITETSTGRLYCVICTAEHGVEHMNKSDFCYSCLLRTNFEWENKSILLISFDLLTYPAIIGLYLCNYPLGLPSWCQNLYTQGRSEFWMQACFSERHIHISCPHTTEIISTSNTEVATAKQSVGEILSCRLWLMKVSHSAEHPEEVI